MALIDAQGKVGQLPVPPPLTANIFGIDVVNVNEAIANWQNVDGNGLLGKGCLGQTFRTLDKSTSETLKQCLNVSNPVSQSLILPPIKVLNPGSHGKLYGCLEGGF